MTQHDSTTRVADEPGPDYWQPLKADRIEAPIGEQPAEQAMDIVEIDGKRYRREAVARCPKKGESYQGSFANVVCKAGFNYTCNQHHILHEITEAEPAVTEQPIPTAQENPRGLHQRYRVEKLDGTTDPNAVYLVLRLDRAGTDPIWTEACRQAALHLGRSLYDSHLSEMASDITMLVRKIGVEVPPAVSEPAPSPETGEQGDRHYVVAGDSVWYVWEYRGPLGKFLVASGETPEIAKSIAAYLNGNAPEHATIREQAQEIERLHGEVLKRDKQVVATVLSDADSHSRTLHELRKRNQECNDLRTQLQQANEQNSKQAVKILRLRQLPWDYSRPWTVADVNELERALSIEVAGTSPAYVPPSPSQPATTSPAAASAGSHCPACKAAAMVDGQCNNCGGSMCAGGSVFSAPAPVADKPHVMVPQDDPTCGPIIADGRVNPHESLKGRIEPTPASPAEAIAGSDDIPHPEARTYSVRPSGDGLFVIDCEYPDGKGHPIAGELALYDAERIKLLLTEDERRKPRKSAPAPAAESGRDATADRLGHQQWVIADIAGHGWMLRPGEYWLTEEEMQAPRDWLSNRPVIESKLAQLATYREAAERLDIRKIVNAALTALGGMRPSQLAFHHSAIYAGKQELAAQLAEQKEEGK